VEIVREFEILPARPGSEFRYPVILFAAATAFETPDLAPPYGPDTVAPVMTHLYADPANALVEPGEMLLIGCARRRGEDVEGRQF
jgi:hypothetical protein